MIRLWLYRRRNKLVSMRMFMLHRLSRKERMRAYLKKRFGIPKMEPGDV